MGAAARTHIGRPQTCQHVSLTSADQIAKYSWEEEDSTDPVLLGLLPPPPSSIFIEVEGGGGGPREPDLHCVPPPNSHKRILLSKRDFVH
eukprot:6922338-Pyramimonas_sp.AAC.1